jgi:hypothetical protein
VETAIQFLKEVISKFLLPPKPVFYGNMARYEQMESQRQGFMRVVQQMKTIDEQEIQPLKARYEALHPVFKAKERKELEKKLNIAAMHRNSLELQLSSSIEDAGYRNIRNFMKDYNKYSGEVSQYEAEVSDWERECREKEIERKYTNKEEHVDIVRKNIKR